MTNEEYIRIKAKQQEEHKKREKKVRIMRGLIVTGALASVISLGYNIYKHDKSHLSTSEILWELEVHSGHGNIDGHHVEYYNDHDCEVPFDGETEFEVRLADKMENDYSKPVIDETLEIFDEMCNDRVQEAKDRFEELEDSLEKRPDGKYHFSTEKKAKTF